MIHVNLQNRYSLPVPDSDTNRDVYFSSSPALLSSVDDFYLSLDATEAAGGTQLAVIETTNEVYNPDLFDKVVPQSILSWMRVITANSISSSGPGVRKIYLFYYLFSIFPFSIFLICS